MPDSTFIGLDVHKATISKTAVQKSAMTRRDGRAAGGVNLTILAFSGNREGGSIYTVQLYRKVRFACRDGMSERAAARQFGISRESVRFCRRRLES